MFIQLADIQQLFPECQGRIIDNNLPFCLGNFMILNKSYTPPCYSPHNLYIINDMDIFQTLQPAPHMSILLLTDNIDMPINDFLKYDFSINMLLLQTLDLDMVYKKLVSFYDEKCGLGLLSDSLMEILFFENGIQAMLEKVYPAFSNPIYVFDTNFRLIATTWDAAIDTDQGSSIVASGGFTQKEFEILNKSGNYSRLKNNEFPVKTKHPVYGYDQLLCPIDTQRDMGHIVINGLNRPLNEIDQKMLYVLKKAIDQQLKKDEFIRNNRGFHYEYFLRDLLDAKIAVSRTYEFHSDFAKSEFSGNLYCMLIETVRSSYTLNTWHIRNLFETKFQGTKTLMYNGSIIILFRLPKSSYFTRDDYLSINEICQEYGLYAGMSNVFSNIVHVKEYYQQALRSIELGICHSTEPAVFSYQDYYLEHMTAIFSQKESSITFCHPQLKFLMEYDKENETDLAYILYVYLTCERNIATASQTLFMHRNTLVYKLKKIASLITANLDNYLERQHIILSYELFKSQGKVT